MSDIPHPRETMRLFGHDEARIEFIASLESGKLHHAWILGGMEGIGKATLAYHLIHFILSGKEVNEDSRDFHKIKAQSHPNLLVLERPLETTATGLTRDIKAETVRKIHAFFGSTAGEGGYRICLVDSLEDLNATGTNALLKMVEEPPEKSLFFIISHSVGRILPTIRSRSRLLKLKPLSDSDMKKALFPFDIHPPLSHEGSVKNALLLASDEAQKIIALTQEALKSRSLATIASLADMLATKELTYLDIFIGQIEQSLQIQMRDLSKQLGQEAQLTHLYSTWQKLNEELTKTKALNLDRKAFVFAVFQWV